MQGYGYLYQGHVNTESSPIRMAKDGWTALAVDSKYSATLAAVWSMKKNRKFSLA